MLDILGNVFGRSKKDKASGANTSTASSSSEAGASSDGFAVVGHDPSGGQVPFIYPTMLTNEMLRPSPANAASASTTPAAAATTAIAASTSSASLASSHSTPFSASNSAPYPPVTQNTNTWNSHTDNLTLLRNMNGLHHISAMDQVPFVPHSAYADPGRSSSSAADAKDDIRRCYAAIDRVSVLLAAPSQSDYNFETERSVVRETSASSWQTFT